MVHQEGPITAATGTTTTEEEKKHDGADDDDVVVVGGGCETRYTHLRDMNETDAGVLDKRFLELASAEALTVRLLCDQLYRGGKGVVLAGRVSLLGHALESATRAYRAGEPEEFVVAGLLHDIGELLTPVNHGEVAAALLRPYVLPETDWALSAHECFQFYHYSPAYPALGIETEADREGPRNTAASGYRNARASLLEKKKKEARVPFRVFDAALRLSEYDAASFGGLSDTPSLEFFAPMVLRVLSRPPYWALERCAESLPNAQQQNISLGKSQIQQCYFPPAEEAEAEEERDHRNSEKKSCSPPLLRWCLNDADPATDDVASKEVAKKVAERVMGKDNNNVGGDDATAIVYDTPFPNGSAPWSGGGPPPLSSSSSSAENSGSNDGTRNKKNNGSGGGFRVLSPSTYEFEDVFSSSPDSEKKHHHRDLLESLLRDGIVLVTGLPHEEVGVVDAAAGEKKDDDAAAERPSHHRYHAHALVERLFVPREGGTCSEIPFWEARGMTHHVHLNAFENSGAPNAHASYGSTLLPMHTDGSYLETATPRVKALATIDYREDDDNNSDNNTTEHRRPPPFNTFTDGFFALQRGIDSGILSAKDVELLRKVSILHGIVDKEDSKPIYAWTKILSYDGDGRAVLKWNAHDRAKQTASSSFSSSHHHEPPPADPTPWELIAACNDYNDAIDDDEDNEEETDVSSSSRPDNSEEQKLRRYLEESVLPRVDKLLQDPEHMLYVRLDPGTMAICDNYRVLHGRERFTSRAKRRIAGADIADVALRAKWRELSSTAS